ncbi:MAG: DNA alkylation repair protein [Chloroflexota bacterium]|nr:DNA alkylation repair protein [Chloroflexota bacterium]
MTHRRPPGEATTRAVAFVAARRERAAAIGRALADHVTDPETFATRLRAGLVELADPDYVAGQQIVAPGIGPVLGVRWPLNAAVARGFRAETKNDRPSQLLFVADRLFRENHLEMRWFAFGLLERLLVVDPERTWQLLRRAAREAGDWITVDTLAHAYGRGILLEEYRWAELEQLVFSPSRWERRLVGSTIATLPFIDRTAGRQPQIAAHGLGLIGQLIGDDEPDVQKALAWALRSLVLVDPAAVEAFCAAEAEAAVRDQDGNRAWVIRDALVKLDSVLAAGLREQLAGLRRRPGSAATSMASATAARFGSVGLGRTMPEPPLTSP